MYEDGVGLGNYLGGRVWITYVYAYAFDFLRERKHLSSTPGPYAKIL